MTILQACLLGVVQGITEFLPISSSGHLIIFPELFGWQSQGMDFDVMIHVATLFAILWALRSDVRMVVTDFISGRSRKLGWMIVAATIPVAGVGFLLSESVLESMRTVQVVAWSLIGWGVVLATADYLATRVGNKTKLAKLSWSQAIFVGLFQAVALIPGTSRSGITMTAGLFAGMTRDTAARFSFLLAIPAIAGAGVLTAVDVVQAGGFSTPIIPLVAGFIAAFLAGSFAIKFLLAFLKKANFMWFAGYRIALGVILLLFLM